MKTSIKKRILLPVLIVGLAWMFASQVAAQTYTILYSFGINGTGPEAGLIFSSNTLYGTTAFGDDWENGMVFAFSTVSNLFVPLHNFSEVSNDDEGGTNSDGANPSAGLILSGNTLYGTTCGGGASADGTVFKVNTDGDGFANLQSFPTNTEFFLATAGSQAGLILSGNMLYGTTTYGGSSRYGTVFAVTTNGTGFTNLHSFTGDSIQGGDPQAGLILSGSTLYGTTQGDDTSSAGTVFALNTNGTGFTNLHKFNGDPEGSQPCAGLILSGGTLYGTTSSGGYIYGNGTVFAVNTNGTGFTTLYTFTCGTNDGCEPQGGLVLAGHTLYGTTKNSSSSSVLGTLFAVNTDGTGFMNLHSFTGYPSDGATPLVGLALSGNTLYGTTYFGGGLDCGTIFSLSLPMLTQLSIMPSGGSVVFTWPTNVAGFTLKSTTQLGSSTSWGTVSPAPVVVNGQFTVTNLISGNAMFYRLVQ